MIHRRGLQLSGALVAAIVWYCSWVTADERVDASRIIIRIDEVDVEDGELRLILQDSGLATQTSPTTRQASAAVLVRQHLAMKSLLHLGGKSIQAISDREMNLASEQLESSGSSLAKAANDRGVSQQAYERYLRWQIAWREYLKSRVTDAALKSYFESHKDQYGGREYLVSQIFVGIDQTGDLVAEPVKSKWKQLEGLATTIRQSNDVAKSFATAAKQHSEAGSASQGGDMGWVGLDGDLPSSVMKVVRKATVGDLVGPVSSPFGHHLLLVREQRESHANWEALTDQSQLRRDLTQDLFLDLVKRQDSAVVSYLDETLSPKIR
jgi:PPIC-type PPIASE domain